MNNTLEILITAKDEASAKLQTFSSKVQDLQPVFRGMAVAGGVAFASITAFANESIKAAQESQKVQAQLGAVLKSTAGVAGVTKESAIALASSLESVTTFSDEAVLSVENLLLTFTKIGKDIMPQATETVLDMATAMGTDTKSASIQLGKALQDPITGISALRRVGVNFSEAQQEVIKRLVETGKSAEAQKLILAELAIEFGGSARSAAQTFGGSIEQAKNQIDNMQEEIGNALIPVLAGLLAMITPIIKSVTEWTHAHPELTKWIVILGAGVSGLVLAIGALGVLLPSIITFFGLMSAPVLAVIGILAGLALAVTNVTKIMLIFKDDWEDTWNGIKLYTKDVVDSITAFWTPFLNVLDNIIGKIQSITGSIKGGIGGALTSAYNFVVGKHAQGGNVMGGSTYLVGERGPEYFTPSSGGVIGSNASLAGMGGGMTLVVNMNGGTYLSERVAKDIGDKIINQFQRLTRK